MPHYILEIEKSYIVKQLNNSNVVKVPQLIGKRTEEPIYSRSPGSPDPPVLSQVPSTQPNVKKKTEFFSPIY